MNTNKHVNGPTSLDTILTDVFKTVIPGGETMDKAHGHVNTPRIRSTPNTAVPGAATPPATPASQQAEPEYVLFIAIDWGDRKHNLCSWDPNTRQRTHHDLEHTPNALNAWLMDLHQHSPDKKIAVALEQKHGSLMNVLLEDDRLGIYPVNPATSAQYRQAFHSSGAKDDPTDADLLLDLLLLHRNRLTRVTPENPLTRKLQILTRTRRDAVNLRTQLNNRLKALLKQYYPLFLRVCGEDLDAPMACQLLLKYPTFDALTHAEPDALRQFYISHGCWRPRVLNHRLELIRNAQPLTSDEAIIQPAIMEAKMLTELLLKAGENIKTYDRTIAECFLQHEDASIFTSFPGAGSVFSSRVLAAFGTNRERFQSAIEVQNTVGISPVKKASGNTMIIHWRKACPKFLRQSFQEYANESIRHSIWARAYDQMQRERGKKHHAAIRALAFTWIRMMFRCWQTRQSYDELRYLKTLQ